MPRYCSQDPGGWGTSTWAWLSPVPVPTAFHEMCRDEYVMLMTWKKAAAGEIIYNKCPPNASGEGQVLPLRAPPLSLLLRPSGFPASWIILRCRIKWVRAQLPLPALCPVPCRVCQPPLSPQCPGRGILGAAQLCPLHLPRVPLPVSVSECSLLGWGHTRSTPDAGRGRREFHSHTCPCALAYIRCAHFCLAVPLLVWQTPTHISRPNSQECSLLPDAYLCSFSFSVIKCNECSSVIKCNECCPARLGAP